MHLYVDTCGHLSVGDTAFLGLGNAGEVVVRQKCRGATVRCFFSMMRDPAVNEPPIFDGKSPPIYGKTGGG